MRKRTKILLAISAVTLLACAGGVFAFAMIAATTSFFDIAIMGGLLTAGLLVGTATTSAVTAGIKKKMLKMQTETQAKLLETKLSKDLTNTNTKQLAKNLTRANEFLAKDDTMGPLNDEGYSKSDTARLVTKRKMLEGRQIVVGATGSPSRAKSLSKKVNSIQTVIDSSASVVPSSGRHNYKSTIVVTGGAKIEDARNQISCSTTKALKEFSTFIESNEAIRNRINAKEKNSYGYSVSVNFNDDSKKIFARSNSNKNMERCELILLKEVKDEYEHNPEAINDNSFPIIIKRKHFTVESKGKGTMLNINNINDLNERIALLEEFLMHPEKFKSNEKVDYIKRTYEEKEPELQVE